MKRIGKILCILMGIIIVSSSVMPLSPSFSAAAAGEITNADFLHVNSGGELVTKSGKKVVLRGTNLGGWLIQENWMCPVAGKDKEWANLCTIEVLQKRKFSESEIQKLFDEYQDNWITPDDLQIIADAGCNVVRVPFWYRNFMKNTKGTWINSDLDANPGFKRLDWVIKKAGELGMYVILDMHGCPGGQSLDHSCGTLGSNDLYTNKTYQKTMKKLWKAIAKRYAGNATVAAYDIMNEPNNNGKEAYDNEKLRLKANNESNEIYEMMIPVIRSLDKDHIITIEGIWEAKNLPNPKDKGWTNMMYQVHLYDDDSDQFWRNAKATVLRTKDYGVAAYVGEFNNIEGIGICENMATDREAMQTINWTTWTYKAGNSNYKGLAVGSNFCWYYAPLTPVDPNKDSFKDIKEKWGKQIQTKHFTAQPKVINAIRVGTQAVTDFTLEDEKTITLGEIDVIEPEFDPPGTSSTKIKWSSSDESVAIVSPKGAAGIITTKAKGTTTITATLVTGTRTITRTTKLRVASKGRDTVLVLDVSGSMSGDPMEEMRKSAIRFCDDLLADEYNNRVGIVYYDSFVNKFDLTNDLGTLKSQINSLTDGSMTNMEGGLAAAKEMLDYQGKADNIKNIVVMADGLPNEGKISDSDSFSVFPGTWSYAGYENAVVDTAEEIKQKYNLYSLGFFHSLYDDAKTNAVNLMKQIAKSDSDFYTVDKAEDLQFAFGDIAESISNGSRIVINIACPVDVTVTAAGEKLSSESIGYNDSASFGSLQLLGKNQDIKVLSLDPDKVYDVDLAGTDAGTMDYAVNYFDDSENLIDYRQFSAVPLSNATLMYSSTDNANDADVELSIDNDGDGTTDEVLKAGKNTETVYEPPEIDGPDEIIETEESDSDSLPLILIIIGAIVLLIVVVIIIVVASKSKKKKPEDDAETPTVYPEDYPEAETPVVAEAPARDANTGSITILTGSMEGTSIPIQDGEMVTLGKDKKLARLAFSGDYNHVSRVHCTVTFSARHRKYYVTDCSSNGTYRENRARLEKGKRTAVEPNSVILLADERCSVRLK